MGEVWLAEHALLGRRAAIKLLRQGLSNEPEMVSRFFNEARAATAIADPGIVQIFDFGYHTDGRAYIVMELLDGESLDKRLSRVGTMPITDALRTIRQIASSVGAAHARNIIHRDLKPENIMLVLDPEVAGGERAKILDFGVAKLGDGLGRAKKTQTDIVIGTPLYMSPEQCRGDAARVDARTDIYSLGCVLYELVVGVTPYNDEAIGVLLLKHVSAPVPRASSRLIAMPPAVDELIARCMAKQAADRFANGAELALAIGVLLDSMAPRGSLAMVSTKQPSTPGVAPLATGAPTPVQVPVVIESPVFAQARSNVESCEQRIEPAPRRSHQVLALAGIGALAFGITGFVLVTLRSGTHTAASRPAHVVAPTAGQASPPAPAPAPTATPPVSPAELTRPAISETAAAFVEWAKSHVDEPCPSHGELGSHLDPWGHALSISCTDQPAAQRIGILSAGPDGKLGTNDDIASWDLGAGLTDLLRGSRWAPHPIIHKAPPPAPPPKRVAPPPASQGTSFAGTTLGSDGIPTNR